MIKLGLAVLSSLFINVMPLQGAEVNIQDEMTQIEYLKEDNKEEYLIQYKNIIEEYSDEFDPPESIYDVTTDEEFYFLAQVVETEIEAGNFDQKVNVANVIINRVESDKFPNTFTEVLKQKNQFTPVLTGSYKRKTPTQSTINAIEYAYMFGDTTNGATYFHSGSSGWHSRNLNFIFNDGKHNFYE